MFDHGGTKQLHRVEGRDVLGAVRQHDGYLVAGANAKSLEPGRSGAHLGIELRVGLRLSKEVGGGFIGVDPQVIAVVVDDGFIAIVQRVWGPIAVVLEPGSGGGSGHAENLSFGYKNYF